MSAKQSAKVEKTTITIKKETLEKLKEIVKDAAYPFKLPLIDLFDLMVKHKDMTIKFIRDLIDAERHIYRINRNIEEAEKEYPPEEHVLKRIRKLEEQFRREEEKRGEE